MVRLWVNVSENARSERVKISKFTSAQTHDHGTFVSKMPFVAKTSSYSRDTLRLNPVIQAVAANDDRPHLIPIDCAQI